MGFDKLFVGIGGRSVLEWSVRAMLDCQPVRRVVVVCSKGREEAVRALVGNWQGVVGVVPGGAERSDSVAAGFRFLGGADKTRWVAVHDAARPLVRKEAVEECFFEARRVGAAALAVRVADTLHRTDSSGLLVETVSRENLWQVQTPQIIRSDWLARLLDGPGGTDEAGALLRLGLPVGLVENAFPNPKMTVPADVPMMEALAAGRPDRI